MNRIKVQYIISDINKALAFEWISENLDSSKIELSFVLINNESTDLEKHLKPNHNVWRVNDKSGFGKVTTFLSLCKILIKSKPDIVHCHMRTAQLFGIFAAFICQTNKRIYTRHNSTYNHKYYPSSVKYDRLVNRLATHVVAISKNVRNVLIERESCPSEKVVLIRHGFDLESFKTVSLNRVQSLSSKWDIPTDRKIIGIVSRLLELKGLEYAIQAFKDLLKIDSNFYLIMANARGPYEAEIRQALSEIPSENYSLIPFEEDIQALYKVFDYYIHCPIDAEIEAFGQTYVEALASGVPSIFTMSGVAPEFIKDYQNALVVPFKNSEKIREAILTLDSSPELRTLLIKNGILSLEPFSLDKYITELEKLYLT